MEVGDSPLEGFLDDAVTRLVALMEALADDPDPVTMNTSIRVPVLLRDAAAAAVDLGLAGSASELTVRGLRNALEAAVQGAALEDHYLAHPQVRPSLAELAQAAALLDDHALAGRNELIELAAQQVALLKQNPSPDDVLLFAAGLVHAA
jgi:hypothetical protein